ncbi:MAG TPA: glycosyltransferase [Candidatus Binatia bacterium]|jgi:glycosyltransferase involved in cell wall biosynthesis|nr:glycosyltransferase [Candidatus Binatia bacterium]
MRLAVYCPHYEDLGGVRLVAQRLTGEMLRRGHEITVIARWYAALAPGRTRDPATDAALVRLLLPRTPHRGAGLTAHRRFVRRFPRSVWRLVRELGAIRPDVVAAHCSKFHAPYLAAIAAARRVPIVLHLHNGARTADGPESPALTRLLLRASRRVIAVSPAVAEYARQALPSAADRVVVVPNGVDPEEFLEVAPIARARPFVLGVGRLAEQKGFDLLIDALPATDLDLVLAGDGPERERLARRAAARGVGDRVEFLGAVPRATVAGLLRGAAVVAMPSRFEGHPLVCLEAMLAGAPLVTAAIPGLPPELVDGETGLIVPPEDPRALGAALTALAASPARARALGRAAAAAARRFPTWDAVATRVLAEYAAAWRPTAPPAAGLGDGSDA